MLRSGSLPVTCPDRVAVLEGVLAQRNSCAEQLVIGGHDGGDQLRVRLGSVGQGRVHSMNLSYSCVDVVAAGRSPAAWPSWTAMYTAKSVRRGPYCSLSWMRAGEHGQSFPQQLQSQLGRCGVCWSVAVVVTRTTTVSALGALGRA
ncbi:hypothetical protein [Phytohabitans aurantiacus]|uniref:hypothetical protein n=1 Tax=Phytohabitans aurantiacus TaxID=3016789 RepID=UPI002490B7CE|nr:hypothetical protein [Phytohabitans aurantiacus]